MTLGYGRRRGARRPATVSASTPTRCGRAARVVRPRSRGGAHRRPLPAGEQSGQLRHGGPRPGANDNRGPLAAPQPNAAPTGGLALPGVHVSVERLGHGHRPERVHRLQRVHRRLPGREQHPGCRQGRGRPRPRDALAAPRHLLRGTRQPALAATAGAVHAVRERAVRAGLSRWAPPCTATRA